MNLYLLEIVLKFLRMIFVAFISLFNITLYAENEIIKENSIMNANTYAVNRVVITENVVKPTSNIKTTSINNKSIQEKNNVQRKNTIQPKVQKKAEQKQVVKETTTNTVKNNPIEEYTGRLTGYGPDCAGCSGRGNLACKTREKKTFSLVKDGIYYTDKEYGKVRILAAATTKFKCGTIIVVTKPGMEPFTGIVLDTGGSMRKAWSNGNVWMDLAYSSESMSGSDKLTGKNIKFSVQRFGW